MAFVAWHQNQRTFFGHPPDPVQAFIVYHHSFKYIFEHPSQYYVIHPDYCWIIISRDLIEKINRLFMRMNGRQIRFVRTICNDISDFTVGQHLLLDFQLGF